MASRELAAEMYDTLILIGPELVAAQPEDKREEIAKATVEVIDALATAYMVFPPYVPQKASLKVKMNRKRRRKRR